MEEQVGGHVEAEADEKAEQNGGHHEASPHTSSLLS